MTILCYHAVQQHWTSPLAIDPSVFEAQASWLARRRTVVPLSTAVERLDGRGRLPRGMAALTFDDGLQSVHQHAWPVLRRLRLPATVFLVAETLSPEGRAVDWVDTPPPYPLQTLTLDEVLEMQSEGVSFASHSYSHLDLPSLGHEECVTDLRRSRELLEDLLKMSVPYLAYPRGRHNAGVRAAAAEAGYSRSFTLPQGKESFDAHAIPRVGIFQGNGKATLVAKTDPSYLGFRMSPAFSILRSAAAGLGAPPRP